VIDHLRRSLTNAFAAEPVDRAAELREDAAWQSAALQNENTLFLPVLDGNSLFLIGAPASYRLPRSQISDQVLEAVEQVFLGKAAGGAVYALGLTPEVEDFRRQLEVDGEFKDLWRNGTLLDADDAGLLAYARGMCLWHQRHGYCSQCGGPTTAVRAGHARECASCQALSFPRTDPAVIVLVGDENRCLLGRQAAWPAGMYSTIAGFVEPGETLEQAVVREVREETGVNLAQVTYHSSQPWPFPSSIMLGFSARPDDTEITVGSELDDARWFERDAVAAAFTGQGDVRVPPRHSIAHQLIRHWLDAS
jgi:NAD+ diphosphatase